MLVYTFNLSCLVRYAYCQHATIGIGHRYDRNRKCFRVKKAHPVHV